jgi:hypothetical protein
MTNGNWLSRKEYLVYGMNAIFTKFITPKMKNKSEMLCILTWGLVLYKLLNDKKNVPKVGILINL